MDLSQTNGGKNTFGVSWANRFWKRHNLTSRAASTKMRELPLDFALKKEEYIKIGALAITEFKIPPQLVIGSDETNALFVSVAKRTRTKIGAKRVRLIGVGQDKSQITTTLAGTEAGEMLPIQYIFGGKTNKCHPKLPPPTGSYFTHTESHWQSGSTYLEYVIKIIVPFKDAFIERNGFAIDQKALLKHDLHTFLTLTLPS